MVSEFVDAKICWLSDLDLTKIWQTWGSAKADQSQSDKPLSIGGKAYERGVGTRAASEIHIDLVGGVERFCAEAGLDDSCGGGGTARFFVFGDGNLLFDSGEMKTGEAAKVVDLDLKSVQRLLLAVDDCGNISANDHADWADAYFVLGSGQAQIVDVPKPEEVILTPKPRPEPRINGSRAYGCRPGNPFLYRIPATGERPMQFVAEGLPKSLNLDEENGIISGGAPPRGEYSVMLRAKNQHGEAQLAFRIISGDQLALTPPMGWNSWYTHWNHVTDKKVRFATDVVLRSGLADAGYQFICIDDCWANAATEEEKDSMRVGPRRDSERNIVTNQHFPDMKELVDFVHSKGLKAGIYTSPGPQTCCKFEGAWKHEEKDAAKFVEWGFDLLKYDWCYYGFITGENPTLEEMKKPYALMGEILKRQKRDVVFSLCQYGMGDVWEWGAEVGGHYWRTGGDLAMELPFFFHVALRNAGHGQWSKSGSWNDPDFIMIGYMGEQKGEPKKFPLTPNEQYSFMSLWCLMAAPLLYSGNMEMLDEFTLSILCNPEVIEVDQDPLGRSAEVVRKDPKTFLMIKDMEDGSKAIGFFNMSRFFEAKVALNWQDAGLNGPQIARDLWRQKDLGIFEDQFEATVPPRGVTFLRLSPAKK